MSTPQPGPAVPRPVPPPATSSARLRLGSALQDLDDLDDRPLHEHVEAFEHVHRALQDALATLDER